MENSMVVPQKIKSGIAIWSSNSTSVYIQKNWKQDIEEILVHLCEQY